MANLIIKPSSGGSLKLQEDGGTDAISIDTSGVSTIANATITAGTFPAGHVLQAFAVRSITPTSVISAGTTLLTKTFNRTKGNSHFICSAILCVGMYTDASNQDTADPNARWVVNSGSVTSYDALTNDGFWHSDVPKFYGSGSHFDKYDVNYYHCTEDLTHISSGSDNDSVTIAVYVAAGAKGMWLNRSQSSSASGGISSLQILEVAS